MGGSDGNAVLNPRGYLIRLESCFVMYHPRHSEHETKHVEVVVWDDWMETQYLVSMGSYSFEILCSAQASTTNTRARTHTYALACAHTYSHIHIHTHAHAPTLHWSSCQSGSCFIGGGLGI